jgi:zinc protease
MPTRAKVWRGCAALAAGLALLLAGGVAPAAEKVPLPKDLPAFGADKPLPVPAIHKSKLPNGLTVWLVERPAFPRAVALLAVRGGTASDPKSAEGIASLLADTLKEGTATRTAKAIAEELQSVGGEISTSAGDESIVVTVSGLASGAPTLLSVLADVARNASFPADEVALAKGNALQSLAAQESTPDFLAQKAFAEAVYGAHPYHIVAPTRETITAATPESLQAEFVRRFRPEDALLVIVGDLDQELVSRSVEKAFGPWVARGPGIGVTPPSPPADSRRLLVVNRPGSVQSQIVLGRPAPTATSADYYDLIVANTICAGSYSSRLVGNIREDKGYTYSPRGSVRALPQGGLLTVSAEVRNDVTGASLMEMFYEMDRMATTKPTDEELARAKRFQAGLYLLRNQIQTSVAGTLARNWVNGLPPEALGEYVSRIDAVTADAVRQVGEKYFPSSTQTVVIVGDEAKIRSEVAPFGKVEEIQP